MHFKVAVRSMQAGDSLTGVLRVVSVLIDKLGSGSLMQLVSVVKTTNLFCSDVMVVLGIGDNLHKKIP